MPHAHGKGAPTPSPAHTHGRAFGPGPTHSHAASLGTVGAERTATGTVARSYDDDLAALDFPEICAWGAGALAIAVLAVALLERRWRARWRTLPVARSMLGGAYRGSSVVTAYRARAPAEVYAVAAACLVFACAVVPSAAFAWLAFERHGGFVLCAVGASLAVAGAGVALLARAPNADEAVRLVTLGCGTFFVVLCVAIVAHAIDSPGCVRIAPTSFSADGAGLMVALAFVPVCAALLFVQRRHATAYHAP
jgi:hypothetical protein